MKEDELGQVNGQIRHHLMGQFIECLWFTPDVFYLDPQDNGWGSSPFAIDSKRLREVRSINQNPTAIKLPNLN